MMPVGDSSRFKSMLAFPSVLRETLFVGWQEGHLACNNLCYSPPNVFFWNKWMRKTGRNRLSQVHVENGR